MSGPRVAILTSTGITAEADLDLLFTVTLPSLPFDTRTLVSPSPTSSLISVSVCSVETVTRFVVPASAVLALVLVLVVLVLAWLL